MKINQKKTKTMIFNFTHNYQFMTRLSLNGEYVEVVPETKLLGTIISNDLTWNSNTSNIVRRANARMVLLRKLAEFGAPVNDLKTIYISYIRSVLEQSAVVWHSSLTEENISDLSRVQKTACKVILGGRYKDYEKALEVLDIERLSDRREKLCQTFAKRSIKNGILVFEEINKLNHMTTRNSDKYKVTHCNTERLKKSALPHMQRSLNSLEQ